MNPEIVEQEGEQIVIEGCLSFPGVWGEVKRPLQITVQALNASGEPIVLGAKGEMAKCLCHEIDHLNGSLFTDKVIAYINADEIT